MEEIIKMIDRLSITEKSEPAPNGNELDNASASKAKPKRKKRIRPRLKPVSTETAPPPDGPDDLGLGQYPQPSPAGTAGGLSSETVGESEFKTKQRLAKIQPRSSTPRDSSRSPLTPDDDDYDAFGFGLVRTPSSPKGSGGVSLNTNVIPLTEPYQLPPPPQRVPSTGNDSYISDASSSEDLSPLQIQRNLMEEEDDELRQLFVEGSGGGNQEPPRFHQRSILRNDASFSSSSDESSLIAQTLTDGMREGLSYSDHYIQQRPPELFNNPHSFPKEGSPMRQLDIPPLIMRSVSGSNSQGGTAVAQRQALELKLSLSDNENGEPTTRQTAETPYSYGSMSSIDDQVIINELSVYSLARRLSRGMSIDDPNSGRHNDALQPTIDEEKIVTPPIRGFYTSPHSSIMGNKPTEQRPPTAKPLPTTASQKDSSFLANLREGWMGAGSIASAASATASASIEGAGSFTSPRMNSAFVDELPDDRSMRLQSPPVHDVLSKSSHSSNQTTSYSNKQSLVYSDESVGRRRRLLNSASKSVAGERGASFRDAKPKVYPSRWAMLLYMALLNLLCGWTCFSIAPISAITDQIFDLDAENLVAIFLGAGVFGNICLPAILQRIRLRRTILMGSLLLMTGNMVKSGSTAKTTRSDGWRLYLGFTLAGFSSPLYQSTSTYIVESFFPEFERNFARGVVRHSNQLGIGCAFFFGTLMVKDSETVLSYFHLLSAVSSLLFVAVAMQFDDAPPTPPSESSAVEMVEDNKKKAIAPPIPTIGLNKLLLNPKIQSKSPKDNNYLPPSIQINRQGSLKDPTQIPLIPMIEHNDNDGATPEHDLLLQAMARVPIRRDYGSTSTDTSVTQEGSSATSPRFPILGDPTGRSVMSPLFPIANDTTVGIGQKEEQKKLVSTPYDGADPIVTQIPRQLDIDIRDDQVWRSLKASFSHIGFFYCILAYASSGITLATLSASMTYLVDQDFVGIIGGMFQLSVLLSSIMIRKQTGDKQKNYMIILALSALGILSLSLCAANLNSQGQLWVNLLMVSVFLGPLQAFSTELGVAIVCPLSENSVLVNQQILSSLLSAIGIPAFKSLRETVGTAYAICMLDFIHVLAAIYFGRFYLMHFRQGCEEQGSTHKQGYNTPDPELGSHLHCPEPPIQRSQLVGKKYPFLVPSSSTM